MNSNDEGNTHEEETTDSEHIPCEVEEAEENVRGHIDFSTLSPADTKSTLLRRSRKTVGIKCCRKFEPSGLNIEPYRKKLKVKAVICANVDGPKRKSVPNSYHIAKQKDLLWMFCLYLLPDTTPMWTGWNSLLEKDNTTFLLSYLPQINMSPTSNSVVMETVKRSLKVMVETGKTSIAVTYDLAIVKIALQIQHAESPQFDNIFVKFGGFHIKCAYFNSVGKYINESGGLYILTESSILASGSKKGFIKGQHYN